MKKRKLQVLIKRMSKRFNKVKLKLIRKEKEDLQEQKHHLKLKLKTQ